MSDNPENIVLYRLDLIQRQNNRILELFERLNDDLTNIKARLTGIEGGVAELNGRVDRLETRFDRIERRWDLVDAP
jgi:archaellum component FlaC